MLPQQPDSFIDGLQLHSKNNRLSEKERRLIMNYKETSKRIEEVIGGEIFNPWEHRRFLPAQFEKSCKEDPECKFLHFGFKK